MKYRTLSRTSAQQAEITNRGVRFEVATFSRWPLRLFHDLQNARPADFTPWPAKFAQNDFKWRNPPPENLKSSWSPRHKSALQAPDL